MAGQFTKKADYIYTNHESLEIYEANTNRIEGRKLKRDFQGYNWRC